MALRKFMDEPEQQQWDGSAKWQGTAEPLLNILTKVAGERVAISREWPKKPKGLGGRLREAAPNLRKLGINISFDRTGKRGTRVITVVQARSQIRAKMRRLRQMRLPTVQIQMISTIWVGGRRG